MAADEASNPADEASNLAGETSWRLMKLGSRHFGTPSCSVGLQCGRAFGCWGDTGVSIGVASGCAAFADGVETRQARLSAARFHQILLSHIECPEQDRYARRKCSASVCGCRVRPTSYSAVHLCAFPSRRALLPVSSNGSLMSLHQSEFTHRESTCMNGTSCNPIPPSSLRLENNDDVKP